MLKSGLADERVENEFLFEFKYTKKSTKKNLGKIDEAAKVQVNTYLQHKQIKKHPNLHAWRIVIIGYKLEICEEIK